MSYESLTTTGKLLLEFKYMDNSGTIPYRTALGKSQSSLENRKFKVLTDGYPLITLDPNIVVTQQGWYYVPQSTTPSGSIPGKLPACGGKDR